MKISSGDRGFINWLLCSNSKTRPRPRILVPLRWMERSRKGLPIWVLVPCRCQIFSGWVFFSGHFCVWEFLTKLLIDSSKYSSFIFSLANEFSEKAMAPHSSTLAWKIPWTEDPGRLQSMGLPRVGHDRATSLSLFTFMHWRVKWQPAPVFLPGESQGRGSLVGCRLWGRTESDATEAT